MEFRCIPASLSSSLGACDTVAIGLFASPQNGPEGSSGPSHEGGFEPLDPALAEALGAELEPWLRQRRFKAKPGECLSLQRLGQEPTSVILVGLGEAPSYALSSLQEAAAAAARCALASGSEQLGLALPLAGLDPAEAAAAMAIAVRLSLYEDQRFKGEPKARPLPQRIDLIGLPAEASNGLARVEATCAGVELARQLVAAPPNVATPQHLADTAASIAQNHGLSLKVLERGDCEAAGMGAFLAVAQGSDLPPKFIHLTYTPQGGAQRRVVLVGKGLTFDSGGYNLKTGGSQIEMMKYDMGGSAAVLGAARAIGQLQPAGVEVHVIVASCENMISGGAVHPGDVVTTSKGRTIEINNTDAEGRLTLADALDYACGLEPDAVVDLATLTGACVIALGDEMAGLWSNSDGLAEALLTAGAAGGEALWRMPLRVSYKKGLKSGVADLKNTGPRPGGSITAALFLQDFVTKGLPWAHLDIAGTVWSDKGRGLDPAGATGYGVRTLVEWVCRGASSGS
ncbi:leucyl aminopeptidase [Cyanobium sp. LEGE 06143]|uniref:leucyl aminopeptidase n=1 Tax=Cyanobium sp. LEGE 06143 TaxID=945727 RepID=UPI00187FFD21|nr:leucyl aminopeptidase [Cyanobium sp. LEGE 06143]MBE9173647.1 leucyl aminopeptidase [Cyanobium sp. LEGE 06143]